MEFESSKLTTYKGKKTTNVPQVKLTEFRESITYIHKHPVYIKNHLTCGTSLVVQWLRHCVPNAGGPGSSPGPGTRSHMHAATGAGEPQLRSPPVQLRPDTTN